MELYVRMCHHPHAVRGTVGACALYRAYWMPIGVLSFFLSFFCSYFGVAIGCHDQFPSSGFFRQPAKTPSKNLPKLVPSTACAFYKEPAGDRQSHTIDELPGTVWPALALGPKRKRIKLDPASFICTNDFDIILLRCSPPASTT